MEYWIAMSKKELQISLILLKELELPDVIKVNLEYEPQKSDFEEMIKKNFFEHDDEGTDWNPFVEMVLSSVIHAQSVLKVQNNNFLRKIYFIDETMILMTNNKNEDLYVFYYVPLIPKAIGGITKSLEELKKIMDRKKGDGYELLKIEGWNFGKQTLASSLIFARDDFYLVSEENKDMPASPIEFYELMEYIGKWIVKTHGKSLASKEKSYE